MRTMTQAPPSQDGDIERRAAWRHGNDGVAKGSKLEASEQRYRFLDQLGQSTRSLIDAGEVMATTAQLLGEHLGATRCAYADVDADSDRFTIRADWAVDGVPSSAGVYSLALFGPKAVANLRRGHHLVVNDVDRELGEDGGATMFNAIGIKAIICAGLVKGERLVALMAVHQALPRVWTEDDIALVSEVVDRCWAHIERVRADTMLREQDQRKDEFLATLAHELRNPLAPIRYSLALMKMARDEASMSRTQAVIERQVSLMARLIDDLLDLSRINRGLIQLRREFTPLAPLMQSAVEAALPALEAGKHRFELRLPEVGTQLEADPARIIQVIHNLLTNAAKYTQDGGHIVLSARRENNSAIVEVSDNGAGIPTEELGSLFKMFNQLPHTAARSQGGLGIGLSLVRSLVESHGGRVSVTSPGIGQGSVFSIVLPLALPAPARLPGIDVEGINAAALMGLRVLVVEDNADGRDSLVAWLETLGCDVAGAADGDQAIEQAGRFIPQVVLLDLGLPGRDGFEVARWLRSEPKLASVHIVALTGWGAERDRACTAATGFDDHLTKPVDPIALATYLSSLELQGARAVN